MNCGKCIYWQDYSDRVYARISQAKGELSGAFELRRCRYSPPPTAKTDWQYIYTDVCFTCSAYKDSNSR